MTSGKLKKAIGVDIGATRLRIGVVTEDGDVESIIAEDLKRDPRNPLGQLIQSVQSLPQVARLAGIGIAIPGSVDQEAGCVRQAPNLPELNDQPIVEALHDRFKQRIEIENDANSQLLAEAWCGSAVSCRNALMLTIGTGLGGAALIDGRLLRGDDGMAGEFGHITVDPTGPRCGCGRRGCLECFASLIGLRHLAGYQGLDARSLSGAEMAARAAAGESIWRAIFCEMGRALGQGLASLVNIFNVHRVIIGGGITEAWDLFMPEAERTLKREAFRYPAARVVLSRSSFPSDRAGVIGAASLVLRPSKNDPEK